MNENALTVVILAAGQGRRMKSSLPKVLHPLGGVPLLSHVIQCATKLNPQQIIVVCGPSSQQLKEIYQQPLLQWAYQAHPLGTAHALNQALPLIPSHHRVLILYGDVPLIRASTLTVLIQKSPPTTLGLLIARQKNPKGLGRIIRDDKKNIQAIVEEQDANEVQRRIQEVNTGIWLIDAKHLIKWLPQIKAHNAQQEYYLTDLVQLAVQHQIKIIDVIALAREVQGVNNHYQLACAERYYQQRLARRLLQQGVEIKDPQRIDIRGTLEAKTGVIIDINVIFQGTNILNAGSQIGPHCVLIDCEIGENACIQAFSYLEGAKIGKKAVVGPFARLRPHTVVEENSRIGNFVEIKNAYIGKASKINHLSYIGDAQIGQSVNVGAGTITCNYDGTHKHQTIIEDGVRIGADTQLIAPVHIGQGAVIGAGATLKQNAPAHQLTVTHRLEQRSMPSLTPLDK